MTTIKTIPAERLRGLDVHEGDTLRILVAKESSFLVEVIRRDGPSPTSPSSGQASLWLQSAKGSVLHASGKSSDDLRMDFYRVKYGLSQ